MQYSSNNQSEKGFTLIEMLVISPIIIGLIAVAIAFIVSLTGEALQTLQKNEMSYNTQDALDTIEQSTRLATSALTTTGNLSSPQGRNNDTSAFASSAPQTLVLNTIATTKNPLDPSYNVVYRGATPCDPAQQVYTYFTVLFVDANRLLKRTILPNPAGERCASPFQQNSCNPTNFSSSTQCEVRDEVLLTNVNNFTVAYLNNSGAVVPASSAQSAAAIRIRLTVSTQIIGNTVTYAGSTYVRIASFQST